MKTIKIMIFIMVAFVVVFVVVFFTYNIYAQTYQENHLALTKLYQAILKHTDPIVSGEVKTLNDNIIHYNEIKKSLVDAKKTHNLLKLDLPEKFKSEAIVYHDNIDKYHAVAVTHANLMCAELKSGSPDEVKFKEYAKKLHDAIYLAEKEHQSLVRDIARSIKTDTLKSAKDTLK